MDFGKLQNIEHVDFSLQANHPFTIKTLSNAKATKVQAYVGPPIWANRKWLGKIYPSNAKDADFLHHYSRQFNTIELNVTHYQIPTDDTVTRWKEAVPKDFRFCPKFPQEISHDRQLIGCDALTNTFIKQVQKLDNQLGCCFLQLNQGFDTRRLKVLETYLHALPKDFSLAVEFRHPSWFIEQAIWQETLAMMNERNIGTVMSDVAGRRDVLHMALSNKRFMLRFVGNELHPTDYARVTTWCQRVKTWLENGLQEIVIFVHCGENDFAPELTKFWIDEIDRICEIKIPALVIRPTAVQGSLF